MKAIQNPNLIELSNESSISTKGRASFLDVAYLYEMQHILITSIIYLKVDLHIASTIQWLKY